MDIFQFLDPYLVLQTYYQQRKKYESDFSYAKWSVELGLASSSTLRMMVNRQKRLSMGVAEKFLARLSSTDEQQFFRFLVHYAHAGNQDERAMAWNSISKILERKIQQKEVVDYITYLSSLLCPKIMTLLSFDDLSWTPQKLATVLEVDENSIGAELRKLESAGMVRNIGSEEDQKWSANSDLALVSDRRGDSVLRSYHSACLDEGKAAQDFPVESRKYKSLIVPLDHEEFAELNAEVNAFTKRLLTKFRSSSYRNRRLYKLNLHFYPITKEIEKDSAPEAPCSLSEL